MNSNFPLSHNFTSFLLFYVVLLFSFLSSRVATVLVLKAAVFSEVWLVMLNEALEIKTQLLYLQ